MRVSVILFISCACVCVDFVRSSPMSDRDGDLLARLRRDSYQQFQQKTKQLNTKTQQSASAPFSGKDVPFEPKHNLPPLRKGEYICGDRICKLMPGQVPKGCHGICQYPI